MKKAMVMCMVLAVIGAAAWAADEAKKGDEVTMTGTLSCASCKIAGHECPKGCCANCVKAGDPALLQTDKGELFLMLSKDMGKSAMTSDRMAMLGATVKVTGNVVKEKGLQGIYVEKMEKVADAKVEAKPEEKK